MYQEGKGVLNGYSIEKSKRIVSWAGLVQPTIAFKGVSLVVVGLLRFNENKKLVFRLGTMDGMTWPLEVRKIGRSILNRKSSFYLDVFLVYRFKKIKRILDANGSVIILYRTSAWKEKGRFLKDSWHYIVVRKVTRLSKFKVQVNYWDYGSEKMKVVSLAQYYVSVVKVFVFYQK